MSKLWNAMVTIVFAGVFLLLALFHGPKLFGVTPYAVVSSSMEPDFPVGSLVYAEPCAPEEIQIGDAISFYLADGVVATHQVRDINSVTQEIYTQGINNLDDNGNIQPDAVPVPFHQVIGVVHHSIPGLGYLNSALTSPIGKILIPIVLVCLLISSVLIEKLDTPGKREKKATLSTFKFM